MHDINNVYAASVFSRDIAKTINKTIAKTIIQGANNVMGTMKENVSNVGNAARKSRGYQKVRTEFIRKEKAKNLGKLYCAICDEEIETNGKPLDINFQLEIDHIIAPSNDIKDFLWYDINNLQASHKFCNNKKKRKILTPQLRAKIKAQFSGYIEERKKESNFYNATIESFNMQIPPVEYYSSMEIF